MNRPFSHRRLAEALFPSRALGVLMAIGFLDLASTALLYQWGLITELNPVMRHFLELGVWAFAVAKSATLFAAWAALAWYGRLNRPFVRAACLWGSGAYVLLWAGWSTIGSLTS